MESSDRQQHWENIYQTKLLNEVSWFQPNPVTSLDFIKELDIPASAKIIDIGGGDSFLADYLLKMGYEDISLLDISETAIERAKVRLGERADKVTWITSDITNFKPTEQYDCWHDRAAFHFLTTEKDIAKYIEIVQQSITPDGKVIIGTFSESGPKKCSGIEIQQYSEESLTHRMEKYFEKIKCIYVDHKTPFDTLQNFIFCSFKRKSTL